MTLETQGDFLPDPATVVVVGGGPAGSFFAIRLLRRARQLGRSVRVIILEKKNEICFYRPVPFCSWEGCNYCAGGVSPRLMDILREFLISERSEIMDNGIRLNALGELDRLPNFVRNPLDALMAESSHHTEMVLSLALSYGGREEILRACRALLKQKADPEALEAKDFERELFTCGLPELDLIIRTSGEIRISNFLLWQAAYAELFFTDTYWPDFREQAFLEALLAYQSRERRFGLTGAQSRSTPTK